MPGKTPAKSAGKDSSNSSAELSSGKANKYSIWPKWMDDELIPDKKESNKPTGGDAASRARKGTVLSAGQVDIDRSAEEDILPPSLSKGSVEWVKPGLFIVAPSTPTVVAEPIPNKIDLISENAHLLKSKMMCSIISQIHALWHNREAPHLTTPTTITGEPDGTVQQWRPWNHIQHRKDHSIPMLNPQGTYGVKIFWMGAWRKITVTDNLPILKKPSAAPKPKENQETSLSSGESDRKEVKEENKDDEGEISEVLLPRTANTCELWPIILTKAILKVAALDYKGGSEWKEFGDCSVIHMLTGWYPQTLTTRIESDVLWELLHHSLPLWKRPRDAETNESEEDKGPPSEEGGGEGERDRPSRMVTAQFTSAANGKPLTRAKETLMAESLAVLRDNGVISENFDPRADHAQCVFVRQIRDTPLQPPPKVPPPIPAPEEHAWLGYSLRKREPWKGPSPKPHPPRWVELITPFATARAHTSTVNLEEMKEEVEREEASHPEGEAGATEGESAEDGGDGTNPGEEVEEQPTEQEKKGIWMKFEDFRKAFSSVEIYTPQSQFKFTQSYRDMTATVEMTTQEETKAKGRASHSPANKLKGTESTVADDTNILFIEKDATNGDSEEVELHFVFSCLSNWREGSKDLKTERKKSIALQKRRESILSNPLTQRYSFNYTSTLVHRGAKTSDYTWGAGGRPPPLTIPEADEEDSTAGSTVHLPPTPHSLEEDGEEEKGEEAERVVAGVLVVEEFNWKSIATNMPLLRLVTSGVKGAVVKLDIRQQMMKFHVKVPVGYHLSISSNSEFVLYNESATYDRMHKEGIGYSKVYSGLIPPLPPNSWAVVFREVLQVRRDEQLLAFSLDCPVPGHQLRVVDNDDGREMPRVAHITEPQEYSINKSGYTLLCEMWTRADPVVEGKTWKLRVISSDRDLPLCEGLEKEEEGEEEEGVAEEKKNEGEEVKNKEEGGEEEEGKVAEVAIGTEFYTKEVREYCLPDRDSVLFRYSLRARRTECPITAQLTTSKKDAYIKLEIFEGSEFDGKLVAVTQGRAYCFLPFLTLLPPPSDESDTHGHKFVIVATVLHNSWPFADTAWPYIDEIRSAEEEKVGASGGAGGGGGKGKKPTSASAKSGGKPKKGKGGGGGKEGGKEGSDGVSSSLSLSNIDGSKPHWTLRVAVRQRDKEELEMSRDTEREDELKSMQTAWETQEPGRLKKGQESRQKFLEAHALKPPSTNSEDQQYLTVPSTTSISSSTTPLPTSPSLLPPHAPVPLERIELSLYTRYSNTTPHVLTAEEREKRDEERKETIRQYRAWRASVLRSRDEDRQFRNSEKIRQLQEAEKQQVDYEATRKRMNRGREKIRQAYLAEEKARREAQLAALKAAEEEVVANNARDSKKKGKKK